MKTLKIFGVDMSGTLINRRNRITYITQLSDDLFYFLEEILKDGDKKVLIKDIKKYSLTRYNGKRYKVNLDLNWQKIYSCVKSSVKNESDILIEDTLHVMGSTKEYFIFSSLENYIKDLTQRILKDEFEILITDSYIASELAYSLKDNFPSLDFYLILDKDQDSYGGSNIKKWESWFLLLSKVPKIQKIDFFENPKNNQIFFKSKKFERPVNSSRVLKFGPNDI
jgi:hypothetical protein